MGKFRSLDAAGEKNKNCSEEGEAYSGFALLFAAFFRLRKTCGMDGGMPTTTASPHSVPCAMCQHFEEKRPDFRLNRLFFYTPRYIKIRVGAGQKPVLRQRVLEVCQFERLQNALARSDCVENRLGGRLCDPIGSCKSRLRRSLISRRISSDESGNASPRPRSPEVDILRDTPPAVVRKQLAFA